jgi:hypothetical protein
MSRLQEIKKHLYNVHSTRMIDINNAVEKKQQKQHRNNKLKLNLTEISRISEYVILLLSKSIPLQDQAP